MRPKPDVVILKHGSIIIVRHNGIMAKQPEYVLKCTRAKITADRNDALIDLPHPAEGKHSWALI